MSLKELLGDSAWMFDLGFPILRFDVTMSKTGLLDDLKWSLPAIYTAPKLESISEQPSRCEYRFAWHEKGLMIEVDVNCPNGMIRQGIPSTLAIYIDTRSSPGIHRATHYCHRILYSSPKPTETNRPLQVSGESLRIPRAKEDAPPIRQEDLPAQLTRQNDTRYGWRVFLRSPAMHGFDPNEYPEIGLFAEVTDSDFGGSRMVRSALAPAHEDPSTWCRGKLV